MKGHDASSVSRCFAEVMRGWLEWSPWLDHRWWFLLFVVKSLLHMCRVCLDVFDVSCLWHDRAIICWCAILSAIVHVRFFVRACWSSIGCVNASARLHVRLFVFNCVQLTFAFVAFRTSLLEMYLSWCASGNYRPMQLLLQLLQLTCCFWINSRKKRFRIAASTIHFQSF